jgi:hypothetical protein
MKEQVKHSMKQYGRKLCLNSTNANSVIRITTLGFNKSTKEQIRSGIDAFSGTSDWILSMRDYKSSGWTLPMRDRKSGGWILPMRDHKSSGWILPMRDHKYKANTRKEQKTI